jgi:hypothetical protein
MLFKEIIPVYTENHKRPINTKCTVTDCYSRWYTCFPLAFKAEVDNLFLNVVTGVANEKWNSPHHVKTKQLGCSIEN